MTRYWESLTPHVGLRNWRADELSNAPRLDLSGVWDFKLWDSAAAGSDDRPWDRIQVPGHWVLQQVTPVGELQPQSLLGTAAGPLYTNTAFPIPLNPPHIPEHNPTGEYRTTFEVPAGFPLQAILRFQGADSCAKVWLNGQELGYFTGSRLQAEFDVRLQEGSNELRVLVHRWSAGTYLEDQDMWWLPGLFRTVEVLGVVPGWIDDHVVWADWDPATGMGSLRVEVSGGGVVKIPELGVEIPAGQQVELPVEPWSAESPRLYRGTLSRGEHTVELAVGFRRIEIVDGVLHANGRPLKLRGVNRHEHDPKRGRSLDRATMIRDIELMKAHNINAVRTAHYPPHPEFLRLCDEYGLWVLEECDIETHGFIYDGWARNPANDPDWLPAMLSRIQRMVHRDKNRPSVIIWSLGNESWSGENFAHLTQWIKSVDPTRPVFYERDPSYADSDFYSLMYPPLDVLEKIGQRAEERPNGVSDADDERRRGLPFILCEYAHAMGNGPGSLQDYQRILDQYPRMAGGFVWEWIDHGFTARDGDDEYFISGRDVDYVPSGGGYCHDGLLFADRTPSTGLLELKKAYEPLHIEVGASSVRITSHLHSVTTEGYEFSADGKVLEVPVLEPGQSVELPATAQWVQAKAGENVVAWGQREVPPVPSVAAVGAAPQRVGDEIRLGPAVFDTSGHLLRVGQVAVAGPELVVYRAPTENDRGQGELNNIASIWADTGLDRMFQTGLRVEVGQANLVVRGQLVTTTHPHRVDFTYTYTSDGRGLSLHVATEFVGPWADTPVRHMEILPARLGVQFVLERADLVRWQGRGPHENYVDSHASAPFGEYELTVDELQVPYETPQENGVRSFVSDLAVGGLTVRGDVPFAFSARRWPIAHLEETAHNYQLRDHGKVWLILDHQHQGLGSASCGPALPEQYRIARVPYQWRLDFS